ncbi:hypothetical protein SHI21_07535 [Bacteriovorax sp. PP10]|uniref:Lipoprotein n=1 Tax=Bacteriovorax antarcticus TaxID=3088717 RepID=A0ABU5VSL7_9BACT|nr:hypothetical protein [Bacteriovorax sp. PP10]MEA9356046.1 hypothetical protein [Bacteriovorax sp. PP10]
MKFLMTFVLLTFASASFACTDFAGNYLDDDSNPYSIVQSGCESFTLAGKSNIADGQFRTQQETAAIKISSAASFIDYYLQVENIVDYKTPFPPEMPLDMIPAKYVTLYTIDWKGNLAIDTTVYNNKNEVISSENTTHQRL